MSNLNIADRLVDIVRRETAYSGFISVDEVNLRYERPSGEMSPVVSRSSVERGDAVAVLVWVEESDEILLVRQFRYPTLRHGEPWPIEVVAGKIDAGETAYEAAQRELEEETSLRDVQLIRISEFYGSPGGSSEMLTLYFASVPKAPLEKLGGLPDEDLELLLFPSIQAKEMLAAGQLRDGKTQVCLYWFFANRFETRFSPTSVLRSD